MKHLLRAAVGSFSKNFQKFGSPSPSAVFGSRLGGIARTGLLWRPALMVASPRRQLRTSPLIKSEPDMVDVTFVRADGKKLTTKGKIGDNLLDVVVNNEVDLDGFGACEGTLACSTCHLIFKQEDFDKINEKLTDEELDMLDMAYGLTETSRLGCQVCLTKELDGLEVKVPEGVNDARS